MDREDIDLDLLVDVRPGSSLLDIAGLQIDIEEALGIKVDLCTEAELQPEGTYPRRGPPAVTDSGGVGRRSETLPREQIVETLMAHPPAAFAFFAGCLWRPDI